MEFDREGGEASGGSPAFRQLEQLVRALGEELAGFRRRAQAAESRVRSLEAAAGSGGDLATLDRLRALEDENAVLKERLAYGTAKARAIAARMKFVRQQGERPLSQGRGGSA